jgi:hypothetical protein
MSLSIYIPRMLGNVNKKTVYDVFNHMGIGRVTELDMVYKINDNHNAYYFAFIKISPYDTPQFTALNHKLNKNEQTQLVYDEEAGQYWEIKKYIPQNQRNTENIKPKYLPAFIPSPTWNLQSTGLNAIQPDTFYSSLFGITKTIWTPITPIIESLIGNTYSSAFSEKDKLDLVEEYEELEKGIRITICYI